MFRENKVWHRLITVTYVLCWSDKLHIKRAITISVMLQCIDEDCYMYE